MSARTRGGRALCAYLVANELRFFLHLWQYVAAGARNDYLAEDKRLAKSYLKLFDVI